MKNQLHCFICRGAFPLLLCFCFFTNAFSQHLILGNEDFKVEAGLNFGPTTFLGDLGGNAGYGTKGLKDVNLPVTKMMKGLFITAYPNNWLGFRFAAEYTYLEGADSLIKGNGGEELNRKHRNLDFKSDVWEAYGAIELFPIMLMKHNDPDYAPRLRPYIFAGVGVFHFDPMGSLTDQYGNTTWYHLQPLHTEGQGFPEYPDRKNYALTQVNIPLGGGLKYFVSDRMNISLELLYRQTFTDYIDDVSTTYINPELFDKYLSPANAAIAKQIYDKLPTSQLAGESRFAPGDQRGNPRNTDAYFSILLKFGFRLGTIYESSFSDRQKNQMRCPGRF